MESSTSQEMKGNLDEQLRIMKSQFDQLNLENARLVEQFKEVGKMNNYWQRYDSEREKYIFKLTKSNQELQEKVSSLQHQIEIWNNKEGPLQQPSAQSTNAQDDEQNMKEEKVVIAALVDKIVKLKDRIIELEIGKESIQGKMEEVDILQQQVNVCVEDFKRERQDRERIHGDNLKLRRRLALLENQVCKFQCLKHNKRLSSS